MGKRNKRKSHSVSTREDVGAFASAESSAKAPRLQVASSTGKATTINNNNNREPNEEEEESKTPDVVVPTGELEGVGAPSSAAKRAARRIVPSLTLLERVTVSFGVSVEDANARAVYVIDALRREAAAPDGIIDPSMEGFTADIPSLLYAILRFLDVLFNADNTTHYDDTITAFDACVDALIARWDPSTLSVPNRETIFFPLVISLAPHCANTACDVYRSFIRRGVDINHRNIRGQTCLQAYFNTPEIDFARWSRTFFVFFLVRLGLDFNLPDNEGSTCLHSIVRCQLLDVLKQLIADDAFDDAVDIFVVDSDGHTPRELADLLAIEEPESIPRRDIAYMLRSYERIWHANHKPGILHALDTATPLIPDLTNIVLAYIEGPAAPQTPR